MNDLEYHTLSLACALQSGQRIRLLVYAAPVQEVIPTIFSGDPSHAASSYLCPAVPSPSSASLSKYSLLNPSYSIIFSICLTALYTLITPFNTGIHLIA